MVENLMVICEFCNFAVEMKFSIIHKSLCEKRNLTCGQEFCKFTVKSNEKDLYELHLQNCVNIIRQRIQDDTKLIFYDVIEIDKDKTSTVQNVCPPPLF